MDVAGMAIVVAALYTALRVYVRHRWPVWAGPLKERRLGILVTLILAVTAIKVGEDVLLAESGPFDESILRFVHERVPGWSTGFFELVTATGSMRVLLPLVVVATLALALAKQRVEAGLLAASVSFAAAVVYLVKTALGRTRPALWETEWYWGSSFPSGHTLVLTAFVTACALCISRVAPAAYRYVLPVAILWAMLVGVSRLVLGVHWPTDVLASWCIGALIPLTAGLALGLRDPTRPAQIA